MSDEGKVPMPASGGRDRAVRSDGVSDTTKNESQGGDWPGDNDRPADRDADVVTHNVTETDTATDED